MNDTHHKAYPQSALCPDFFKNHQEYRLWDVTTDRGWSNAALDYSFPEVRARKSGAIAEVAGNYDVDGIEMDFSRNPYAFQPAQAWGKRGILTRFVADVRKELDRIGRKKGKKIGLLARVPFGQEERTEAGIDLKTWIDKKLMDILVMTCLYNQYNQKVEPWLGLCRKRNLLFYPSVENGPMLNQPARHSTVANPTAPAHNYGYPKTPDDQVKLSRGMAQNFLAQGVDGIYMFNGGIVNDLMYGRCTGQGEDKGKTLLCEVKELGSPKTLAGTAKQYVFFEDLPIWVESGRPAQCHQTIRFTVSDPDLKRKGTMAVLSFRQIAEKNTHAPSSRYRQKPIVSPGWMDYYLNGQKLDAKLFSRTRMPKGRIPSGFVLRKHEKIEIALPANRLIMGENTLAFHIPRFPRSKDPHVFIYELIVDVIPKSRK